MVPFIFFPSFGAAGTVIRQTKTGFKMKGTTFGAY